MSIPAPPPPDEQSQEPALKAGAIVSVVTTGVAMLVAFGADGEQAKAVVAFLMALVFAAPLITAAWTRRKVWAPATVARLIHGDDRPTEQ